MRSPQSSVQLQACFRYSEIRSVSRPVLDTENTYLPSTFRVVNARVKATSQRALAKIPQFRMRSNRKSADLARSAYGLFPDLSALSGILL